MTVIPLAKPREKADTNGDQTNQLQTVTNVKKHYIVGASKGWSFLVGIILKAAPIRQKNFKNLQERCQALKKVGIAPCLQVILVGNNPASQSYVGNKKKFIESWGGICQIAHLPENVQEGDFLQTLQKAADDPLIHGCLVQLPLPPQLKKLNLASLIPAKKDVDGFSTENLHHLLTGKRDAIVPCTPRGILTLLKEYEIELAGKYVVIIGRSMIVGKPMALLMLNENATVSICHSHTKDIADHTRRADIIISAVGKKHFFNRNFLDDRRRDQVLVDVGINQNEGGGITGDMDFADLQSVCRAITPVPGGVGPMTVLSLAENLMSLTEKSP